MLRSWAEPRPLQMRARRRISERRMSAGEHRGCWEPARSEEHTSELQSQSNLVCRLLLEKKKKKKTPTSTSPSNQLNVQHTQIIPNLPPASTDGSFQLPYHRISERLYLREALPASDCIDT